MVVAAVENEGRGVAGEVKKAGSDGGLTAVEGVKMAAAVNWVPEVG